MFIIQLALPLKCTRLCKTKDEIENGINCKERVLQEI